jgi:16S rRNA (uracil1498-N3)-methyltransferase
MSDRYFSQTPILHTDARLEGPEAHHLAHVMRAKPGDRVVLFDGSGAEFDAEVRRIGRAEAELAVLARREVDREPAVGLTLAVALPKGDRSRWLVEKAVELGVRRLVPLVTERSVVVPHGKGGRLDRAVIEASKQCGRNRLMEIAPPQGWPELVASTQAAPCRLLAHPRKEGPLAAGPTVADAGPAIGQATREAVVAVGPEGGFTRGEADLALAAGWQLVDLGPRTLRTETAAIFLVALVSK